MLSDISAEDQFPFAKSRLRADILDREPENHFGQSDDDDDRKETAKALPRLGKPSRNDLTPRRKPPTPLPADVEASLISAAQAGDRAAGHCLFTHHEEWCRVEGRKRWHSVTSRRLNDERALSLDDFVAAALEAFWESVRQWKPGCRLNTFLRKSVRGALADIAHEWRDAPGLQIDSRVQRYIRSREGLWDRGSAEFIPAFIEFRGAFPDLSHAQIDFELNASSGIWVQAKYSEEGNVDDDGEYNSDGTFKGSDESAFNGPVSGYEGGPVSEWSRRQARNSLHLARLIEHPNDWVQGKKSGSVWSDRVTADVERRILARLHRMGRRFFAQWLVDRQSTCPPHKEVFPSWTPQAIRVSSVRHFAPLPGPAQATEDSYWNIPHCRKDMLLKRSFNIFAELEPAAPPQQPSFDATISNTIGETLVDSNDNHDLREAA
jgi:hypothetical protein